MLAKCESVINPIDTTTVTILGTKIDIASTKRLLIYNKQRYKSSGNYLPLHDDPDSYNANYAYTIKKLSCSTVTPVSIIASITSKNIEYSRLSFSFDNFFR